MDKPAKGSLKLSSRTAMRTIMLQIVAVVLIAIGLTAYLNYSNFDKVQRHLAESRILVSVGKVKSAINGALSLGLSLEEISNLDEILSEGLATTSVFGVTEISVLDYSGSTVSSTEASGEQWSDVGRWPIEKQQKEVLRSLAADRFAVGIPLMNAFDVQTGWLIVAYDGTNQLIGRHVIGESVRNGFLITSLVAIFLVAIGVSVIMKRDSGSSNAP